MQTCHLHVQVDGNNNRFTLNQVQYEYIPSESEIRLVDDVLSDDMCDWAAPVEEVDGIFRLGGIWYVIQKDGNG